MADVRKPARIPRTFQSRRVPGLGAHGPPTNMDTFAIIPLRYGSLTTGQLYTEVSGQFQDNKRIYFGPVDIDRLRITLLDDRGNLVDLHGGDWCVTLISENLYQY